MSDILSQAEIDELLNALTTGGADTPAAETSEGPKAKPYDFKTANRFPKEQIRTFNIVFQSFSQLFSNRLSSLLRISCECEVLSIDENSFNEFNNSLPTPVVLAIIKAPPMYGTQMIEVSPEVAYMLISRLFGGITSGESSKQFTDIEQALLERLLRQVIDVYDEAWDKVFKLNAQVDRIETSPQFAQITAPNEPVAVIALNIKMGDESGLMSICIPHNSIEPVVKQLNTKTWYTGSALDGYDRKDYDELIRGKVIRTPVSLTALFDQTPATVSDIVNLQVGDVIRLNHGLNKPLTIKVHHIPKFHAQIGTMGSKYALQIVDIIKEGSENEPISG